MHCACIDRAPDSDRARAPATHQNAHLDPEIANDPEIARRDHGPAEQSRLRRVLRPPSECAQTARAFEGTRESVLAPKVGKESWNVLWVGSGFVWCSGFKRARAG